MSTETAPYYRGVGFLRTTPLIPIRPVAFCRCMGTCLNTPHLRCRRCPTPSRAAAIAQVANVNANGRTWRRLMTAQEEAHDGEG